MKGNDSPEFHDSRQFVEEIHVVVLPTERDDLSRSDYNKLS